MKSYPISKERICELLSYDPETGVFLWKIKSGKGRIGAQAGAVQAGYRKISIDRHQIKAHRLAWFLVNGQWPKGQIDHINGNKDDNRIANIRDVPMSINMQNRYEQRKTSGLPRGVRKSGTKFCANIQIGLYATPEEAGRAYIEAKRLLHEGCSR